MHGVLSIIILHYLYLVCGKLRSWLKGHDNFAWGFYPLLLCIFSIFLVLKTTLLLHGTLAINIFFIFFIYCSSGKNELPCQTNDFLPCVKSGQDRGENHIVNWNFIHPFIKKALQHSTNSLISLNNLNLIICNGMKSLSTNSISSSLIRRGSALSFSRYNSSNYFS